jgi:YfiH family protein
VNLRWDAAPAGVSVIFTSRIGGVSEGPFTSLNLGALTADTADAVRENRRRAVEAAGGDPTESTMAWQVAGSIVREVTAEPASGRFLEPGIEPFPKSDGLVTSLAAKPLVLLAADCLPIAVARRDGSRLAVLHAGWQGLLAGICERGAAEVGGDAVAMIGPGAGPCCYEVKDDVGVPLQQRFGEAAVRSGRADLWFAARVALERAGVERVEVAGRCTICNPLEYFSHRRDHGRTGRQGVVGLLARDVRVAV